MNILRRIIPTIIARITGKERYLPVIEWSSKSWTHNVFRLYELICWREYGIRAEMSSGLYFDKKANRLKAYQVAHSFEASIALIETHIRDFLYSPVKMIKGLGFQHYRLYIPALQTSNGIKLHSSPYLFAIAFDSADATRATASASPVSVAHTCTGSDLILITSCSGNQGPTTTLTSVVRNGITSTTINSIIDNVGTGVRTYLSYQVGPTTGTYNVVVTFSSSSNSNGSTSYSGASQTGQPDGNATTTYTTTTSFTQTVTVTASNCWLVATARLASGQDPSGSGGSVVRILEEITLGGGGGIWDSNGTVGTGSQSITVTFSSQFVGGGVVASIKPVAGTAYTTERTETVTNTDTLVKSVTRSISETVTNTDTFIKNTIRTVTESITNTDTFSYVMIFYKELSETVTSVDNIIRDIVRNISETVTNNDVINKITARIVSETTTIADTITNMQVKLIILYENLTLIEDFRMFLNSRVARWRDKYNESKTQDWVEKQDL